MKLLITLLSFFAITALSGFTHQDAVKDYLSITGPIKFGGKEYKLSWSSHPSATFYKQEYLVEGDNLDKYQEMLMIDLVTSTDNVEAVVKAKVAAIETIKKTNPVVQYEVMEKDGEYMLDFLMSQNARDGKSIAIVERNVYRYKKIKDKSGKYGVLLFGVSTRGYGGQISVFFEMLKSSRYDVVNSVGQFQIPEVTILE